MEPELQRDPFVGPRPFERADADFFFGRAGEVQELFSCVFANRVVVLYAASGAGKTSLLNAGVVPLLAREEQFEVLPPARFRRLTADELGDRSVENIYAYTTLLNWGKPEACAGRTLGEFLADLPRARDLRGRPVPRALVFDQFEELFTVYAEYWEQRRAFFEQLANAIAEDPYLRVVLALREDYLAQLEPLLPLLPPYVRFRLERLNRDAAVEAVTRPVLRAGRRFAHGVAERLVDDLLSLRVDIGAAEPIEVAGEYVEPVHLQVAGQSLWADLPPAAEEITNDHVHAFGDVDEALRRFYDDVVRQTTSIAPVRERRLRQWVQQALITSVGTRSTVYRTTESAAGMPNAVVDELENRHLVRAEWRAGTRWYELTHDRLVEPIESSNARFRRGESRRRRKRLLTGAAVLVGVLGVLGAVLGAVLPSSLGPSASIVFDVTPNVAYRPDFGKKLTFPGLQRRGDGGSHLSIQVTTRGYQKFLTIDAAILDAATRKPLAPRQVVTAYVPPRSKDATAKLVDAWAALPGRPGSFVYSIAVSGPKLREDTTSEALSVAVENGRVAVTGQAFVPLRVARLGYGAVFSSNGGINCGSRCTTRLRRGTTVQLKAVPESGSLFVGWRGSGCSGASQCVFKVARPATVTARFVSLRRTLVLGRTRQRRPIRAVEIGNPEAPRKVLVVGCVHGDECSGIAIANRLAKTPPIRGVDLWIVRNLNPDGYAATPPIRQNARRGVDLNRNFSVGWNRAPQKRPGDDQYRGPRAFSEPESRLVRDLIEHIRPAITIWYFAREDPTRGSTVHQAGGQVAIARRYARLVNLLPLRTGSNPGSAPNWQNAKFPQSVAFFVELPFGDSLAPAVVKRHADAVLALARG